MSQILIQQYLNELSDLRRVSGTDRESVVREAFKTLLKGWGKSKDLIFVPEYEHKTTTNDRRYVDGALLHALRVPFGYWEAKDEKDDLDDEIVHKFRRGYPQDNIVFEDSRQAVLIQNKQQIMRCGVDDVSQLGKLLGLFFKYERQEIADFRKAVEQFKKDLPHVLAALRDMIEKAHQANAAFREGSARFLRHAQETINPNVTPADVREMLIQHILTEEIFSHVFDNSDFHRRNNVAKELYRLEETFFTGSVKRKTLDALRPYYAAIKSNAALVSSHQEKQKFLKLIYENFYKVYDKKKADRLGVVYTPNEIVRFMVQSTEWLCKKHFDKHLIDKEVEILDPAAGTGTFIAEIVEHFRGQAGKLRYKYLEQLHANEVAILPYYVANLNIEATFAALTGEFEEFPNLCFVDTLDNTAALKAQKGQHFGDLFGGVSAENVARIKRQNKRRISIVIGNPPYNANQLNENENNRNREYPEVDRRIKATYISASTAQKTKLYDMYARFFRWASDRVDENGIVAFVTNRSFIESRTFDGFRKMVAKEFNNIYVVDLGGDVRADPRLSGTKHNVFGIQTGVAISFMVKRAKAKVCRIHYACRPQLETAEEKLAFLDATQFNKIEFEEVSASANGDWVNQGEAEFRDLVPIADKDTKFGSLGSQDRAIFKLYGNGVNTARDEWVMSWSKTSLQRIAAHLVGAFKKTKAKDIELDQSLKWSRNLKRRFLSGSREEFDAKYIRPTLYRPFVKKFLYDSKIFIDERGPVDEVFVSEVPENKAICVIAGDRQPFSVLASSCVPNFNLYSADSTKYVPRYRFVENTRVDNITDWALKHFCAHYNTPKEQERQINKDAIFNYVYGVLHDPVYREKYALNLKREFPHIPS